MLYDLILKYNSHTGRNAGFNAAALRKHMSRYDCSEDFCTTVAKQFTGLLQDGTIVTNENLFPSFIEPIVNSGVDLTRHDKVFLLATFSAPTIIYALTLPSLLPYKTEILKDILYYKANSIDTKTLSDLIALSDIHTITNTMNDERLNEFAHYINHNSNLSNTVKCLLIFDPLINSGRLVQPENLDELVPYLEALVLEEMREEEMALSGDTSPASSITPVQGE